MPTSFLTAFHFDLTVARADAARRLAGALAKFRGHGLEPFDFARAPWEKGTPRVFGGTTLLHQTFSELTGDPFWGAGFMIVPAPEAQATIVTMTTPGTPEADAWDWVVKLAEDVCVAADVDLALINGFTIDSKGRAKGGTRAGDEVAPGHPPRIVAPWMYWSAVRLRADKIAETMTTITSAARNGPAGETGWIMQVYDDYNAKPPKQLIRECEIAWQVEDIEWIGVA